MNQQRIHKLLELARRYDFTLCLDPADICQLEDAGYIVDLTTGEIIGTNTEWFPLVPVLEMAVQPYGGGG